MYDKRNLRMLARQILAKTRNSPNSPNIIARQNLLIYSIQHIYIICVYYFVLVEIVCSIHVFALYVDIESVLLLCSLIFIHVLE